jgi:glycine cleavage system aminomethyltransferase T
MTAHETLPRRTPLHETHRRLGASMTEFAGWAQLTEGGADHGD